MAPRVPANGEGLLADLDLKLSRAHDTPAAARTAALAARALRRGLSEIPDDIEQNLGWTIVGFIVGVSLGYLLLGCAARVPVHCLAYTQAVPAAAGKEGGGQ